MEGTTYKILQSVEIIETLCQGAANGFGESVLKAQEEKLGLRLPAVLRSFLLRAGRERICGREKEFFTPEQFRVEDGYLLLGKTGSRSQTGILLEDLTKDNPLVSVRDVQGNWNLSAASMEDFLLCELDRRIRKTKTANQSLGALGPYYYCEFLLCREWTPYMDASEVSDSFDVQTCAEEVCRRNGAWEDEDEQDFCGKHWDCPQELKDTLLEKSVTLPDRPYSIAICLEEETGIFYSAHVLQDKQKFESLLQINTGFSDAEQHRAQRLLSQLEEEVHAPVLAHCLAKLPLLPQNVRELAEEELRSHIAETIGDFLELFENNRSWKLGVCVSDKFIACSGIDQRTQSQPLPDLWFGHHLKAAPPLWAPSFVRKIKEKETAPEGAEPFIKEFIYRVHDYNLLNRYSFLARKIVTKEGFSVRTQNYTEEERLALLLFYREMADGVTERIMDCLERKVFSIQIKGKDFCSLCENPMAHLEGWVYQYERTSLRFLDEDRWQ